MSTFQRAQSQWNLNFVCQPKGEKLQAAVAHSHFSLSCPIRLQETLHCWTKIKSTFQLSYRRGNLSSIYG